jgi:hypothetical protein
MKDPRFTQTEESIKLDDCLAIEIVKALWKERDRSKEKQILSIDLDSRKFEQGRQSALLWVIEVISRWNERQSMQNED